MNKQLALIDLGESTHTKEGKQKRPKRHIYKADNSLACGHLPSIGNYRQIPLFLKDFIAVTDCRQCKEFAEGFLKSTSRAFKKSKVETIE